MPAAFVILFESAGWYFSLKIKKEKLHFTKLYLLRTAIDSIHYSVPGGFAAAELLRPLLLKRNMGIEINRGIASGIVTKLSIAIAQLLFIITGIAFMLIFYNEGTAHIQGISDNLIYILSGSFILGVFCLTIFLYKYDGLIKTFSLLKKIKLGLPKKITARTEERVFEINNYIRKFNSDGAYRLICTILLFFMGWMTIAAESLLIFRIIGADLSFSQIIILESAASLIRIIFFFLPSGLGAQDAGLIGMMSAMGIADPVSVSILFISYKRTKEIIWIIFGYILLFRFGLNPMKLYLSKFRKSLKRGEIRLIFSQAE